MLIDLLTGSCTVGDVLYSVVLEQSVLLSIIKESKIGKCREGFFGDTVRSAAWLSVCVRQC